MLISTDGRTKGVAMSTDNKVAPRRSRAAHWVVIAIGGVVVLVPVTLFLVLILSLGFNGSGPTVGQAQTAALSYYSALQRHDYPEAYAVLGPHATVTVDGQPRVIDSVDTLSSLAQAADRKAGGITAYTFTDGQFEAGATTAAPTRRGCPGWRGSDAPPIYRRVIGDSMRSPCVERVLVCTVDSP